MEEMVKLKHLLEHWIEHNEEHEKTYKDWAEKALAAGKPELGDILRRIATETKNMEKFFLKARKEL
jgi:rubrerythrin